MRTQEELAGMKKKIPIRRSKFKAKVQKFLIKKRCKYYLAQDKTMKIFYGHNYTDPKYLQANETSFFFSRYKYEINCRDILTNHLFVGKMYVYFF